MKTLKLLLPIFGALLFCAPSRAKDPGADKNAPLQIAVPVAKAVLHKEAEEFRYTGRVVPISSVNITSRISADLMEVGFEEGDFVKKGHLLYTFDDT